MSGQLPAMTFLFRPASARGRRHVTRSDVIVVGGGFAGMACAAALSAQGRTVTVIESHHGHDPRFRGELIHPRGVRALDDLGLKEPLLKAGGVPVKGFAVTPKAGVDPL